MALDLKRNGETFSKLCDHGRNTVNLLAPPRLQWLLDTYPPEKGEEEVLVIMGLSALELYGGRSPSANKKKAISGPRKLTPKGLKRFESYAAWRAWVEMGCAGGDCDAYSFGAALARYTRPIGAERAMMALIGYFRIGGDDFALFDLVDYVGEVADVLFDYRLLD